MTGAFAGLRPPRARAAGAGGPHPASPASGRGVCGRQSARWRLRRAPLPLGGRGWGRGGGRAAAASAGAEAAPTRPPPQAGEGFVGGNRHRFQSTIVGIGGPERDRSGRATGFGRLRISISFVPIIAGTAAGSEPAAVSHPSRSCVTRPDCCDLPLNILFYYDSMRIEHDHVPCPADAECSQARHPWGLETAMYMFDAGLHRPGGGSEPLRTIFRSTGDGPARAAIALGRHTAATAPLAARAVSCATRAGTQRARGTKQ